MAHDIRVIRLPRHGASCPIGMGVSCSADRNIKCKINEEGIWVEKLDDNPARLIPEELRKPGEAGGVTIDLIHESDYLVELFGVPEKLYNFKGTYSDLEIDSDDLSVYIAKYPTLLAEVHLDYFGRGYRRSIELFCHDGSYLADFGAGTLTLPDGTVQHYEEDVNRRYEREMEYFVDYALTGSGESCNPPALALNVLKLTLGENV